MGPNNQLQTLTVWEIYSHLEAMGKRSQEPIHLDWMTMNFGMDREKLMSYLTALDILGLIDFSDKEKVKFCN